LGGCKLVYIPCNFDGKLVIYFSSHPISQNAIKRQLIARDTKGNYNLIKYKTSMKTTIFYLGSFLIVSNLACQKSDMPLEEQPKGCNVIEVSGSIDQATSWEKGNVYVVNNSDLTVRSTLQIDPGVVIKLKNASINISQGQIIAKGNPQDRIIFTSLADDNHCGDTNSDGTASKATKGDWDRIDINQSNQTSFQYTDIFYAGGVRGGSSNAVSVGSSKAASFLFDHCRIAHTLYTETSYDSSCAFYGSSAMADPSVSKFTNNEFYDNGKPIFLNAFYTLDPSNKFHNSLEPSQKNTHNGIYLTAPSTLDRTGTWNNKEVPYVVSSIYSLFDASTITIGPEVIVKFKNTSSGLQRSAMQNINLHSSAILTSYKDDLHGGDTNGDGLESTPKNGDWFGMKNNFFPIVYFEKSAKILYAKN